jgi:hypothetical protein
MRKVVFVCLTILAGLLGLVTLVNVAYFVAGFFEVGARSLLPATFHLIFTVSLCYFCYRMVRRIRTL